ncbi:MAG: 30S ribosomal protein S8 [bacterium]
MVTDPIADMLTTIRNGLARRHDKISVTYSKMKIGVLEVLKARGMIGEFEVVDTDKLGKKKNISIGLKYYQGKPAITTIKRVSKPGKRIYTDYKSIPVVKNNYGFVILSTSRGIKDTFTAKREKVGGEIMCEVF